MNHRMLTETENKLLKMAVDVVKRAYAPYSGFKVGCAILGADNNIFVGVNCENASFGGTICAERAAALNAVTSGIRSFSVVVVAAGTAPTPPCGICRQFLSEFCSADSIIIFATADGSEFKRIKFAELFPYPFSKDNVK